MGNANSNVADGVKAQAGPSTQKLYKLVDVKGGGLLVDLCKQATTTKNYAALDEAIKTKLEPFLYNNGKGKLFHVSEIVLDRNKRRSKHMHIFKNEADFDNYKPPPDCKDPRMFKEVCWRLDERGAVGETCLHLCFLSATPVHVELAKRLLRFYPKLINDIYQADEYYGENVLHIAIVNEDPSMVKYLLNTGVNVMERCSGAFFSPEDQKGSRVDSLEHEEVDCTPFTNYQGHVYWGEYPASFAACLGQEDIYRMILAKGADPNAQDSNGNTILHILVIIEKQSTFDSAYELGVDVNIKNKLNLTPLTLSAKLARRDLFFHILNIGRETYWQIGSVICAAYPLPQFDTIDTENGGILKDSALNLIAFGESVLHLDLIEGPVVDLLHAKWNTFVKFRFYKQFIMFTIYFLLTIMVMVTRPINKKIGAAGLVNFTEQFMNKSLTIMDDAINSDNATMQDIVFLEIPSQIYELEAGSGVEEESLDEDVNAANYSLLNETHTMWTKCIKKPETDFEWIRFSMEICIVFGAIAYILGALREFSFLGASMFFENMATVPSRVLFLLSCILVNVMVILRLMCLLESEDKVAIVVMLTTAPYFLFFCRGFKTVGPFVVMIYRMLAGDLIRFVTIYLIFVMGFSQAFFIFYISYTNKSKNPLDSPAESIVYMFMVSLTNFQTVYDNMKFTDHDGISKFLIVAYLALVAILLINMLIAMMGNTYTKIAECKNEWLRQWARIVLVVERGVHPKQRHAMQGVYSQPMGDSTRALVLRINQTDDEREEMKDLIDLRRYHDKSVNKRMSKYMTARASAAPRPSIVDTLMPGGHAGVNGNSKLSTTHFSVNSSTNGSNPQKY